MSKTETGFQFRFDGFVPVDFSKPDDVVAASALMQAVEEMLTKGGGEVTADVKPAKRRGATNAKS